MNFDDTTILDKTHNIILDIGTRFTKVGYGNESEPRKIIRTPSFFNYNEYMSNDTEKLWKLEGEKIIQRETININNLMLYTKDSSSIRTDIELFINYIIFNILHLQKLKKEKICTAMITIDFYNTRLCDIYNLIIKTILDYSTINIVKLIPKTILPIFCSGYSSGIVIDIGHIFTHIIPINNGYPYLDISEVLSIGSAELERNLKNFIINDNSEGKTKIKNFESFNKKLYSHLDDLLVRSAICSSRSNLVNQDEMIKFKKEFSKVDCYPDIPVFQLSFYSRLRLGELLFGDTKNDEINIAYSLLKVISNIPNEDRKKLCQNIIISGGTSMIVGFFKRIVNEVNEIVNSESYPEFNLLKPIRNMIRFHKILFPRSNLTWIGASIISNYDRLKYEHLSISKDQLDNKENLIKNILDYYK